MSKGLKTVVAVVVAVAMPYVAPMIASSIGMSAAIGSAVGSVAAGNVIGGAIVGAALGGVSGAALGQDVGRSALMGGLGGGIGGYAQTPATAGASAPGTIGASGQTAATVAPGAAATPGTAVGAAADVGTAGLSGVPGASVPTAGSLGVTQVPAGTWVDGTITQGGMSVAPGARIGFVAGEGGISAPAGSWVGGQQITGGGMTVAPGVGVGSTSIASQAAVPGTASNYIATGTGTGYAPATAQTTNAQQTATQPGSIAQTSPVAQPGAAQSTPIKPATFSDSLKQLPSQIGDKFKDPKVLADMTLRAAGQLAGSYAGDGLSAEERGLLDAQTDELRRLQSENQGLFNQRLQAAQGLIGEAKYFDPSYFGLQGARRTQLAGARAKQAGLRGMTGTARSSEARRFDLATGRDTGTAYDVGYSTGVQGRLQTTQAGLSAMPTGFPSSTVETSNLRGAYADAEARRRQARSDTGAFFGSLTGRADGRGP